MEIKDMRVVEGLQADATQVSVYQVAWNDGAVAKRCGHPRCSPAFVDPRMAEEWYDGYDSTTSLNKRFEMGGSLLGQEVTA